MDVGSFRAPSEGRRSPSPGAPVSPGLVRRQKSLSRRSSGSPRSARAGSIAGVGFDRRVTVEHNDVFYMPIPTDGSPTELLATRFQGILRPSIALSASADLSSLETVSEGAYRVLQGGPDLV